MPRVSPQRNPDEKWCVNCKQFKLKNDFHRSKRRKDGLTSWCKLCTGEYEDHYKEKRKQVRVEREVTGYHIAWWKQKARRNSLSISPVLLMELYLASPQCHYCGIEVNPKGLHIDHKTPRSKGGSDDIENLAITCADCNRLKHQRTEEEFRGFVQQYCQRFTGTW